MTMPEPAPTPGMSELIAAMATAAAADNAEAVWLSVKLGQDGEALAKLIE